MTTILIIEDEKAIRELISELLIIEEFKVVEAANGKDGIAIAQSVLPDLIICDVMMPEVDGYAVLSKLQEDPQTATIPFIFLTAKGTRQDVRVAMNLGADDYLIKPFANDDLLKVIRTRLKKKEMIDQKYLRQLEESKEQLSYFLCHDPLTNLPNQLSLRDNFEKIIVSYKNSLSKSIESLEELHPEIALVVLSFERFSRINDCFGYEGGNELLKQAAERIKKAIIKQGIITRINSNEFVIILMPTESLEDNILSTKERIVNLLERLIKTFSSPFLIQEKEIICPIILGIALYSIHGYTLDKLLKSATKAKESIKNKGGNLYQFYNPKLDRSLPLDALELERDLRYALENGEFVVYYQPQINVKTQQIACGEALIRWNHPQKGLISPYIFIPIAEATGLIQNIGEWVLEKACEQLKIWEYLGLESIRIAVNLSARQFNQENLAQWLATLLQQYQVNPSNIELELTESILVDNIQRSIEQLNSLKSSGIKVAMDDFGTGYSSLSYLQQFPFDILKIDRCFIHEIDHNPKNAAIAQAIINMAHQLNLRVVAEGVETLEELAFVNKNDCDEIQGYFFSQPITAIEFTELLQTKNPFSF